MASPCKDCQVRKAGCWTECQRYMVFSKDCEKRRKKNLQESYINDYVFKSQIGRKGKP